MRSSRRIRLVLLLAVLGSSLTFAPSVAAHAHQHIGELEVVIGWLNEPTFVGQPNGVEITISDHDGEPVLDLAEGDLMVVVSTADQETAPLPLSPGFSLTGGFGTPGQYEAELLPTTPGEYTFHFTGAIHDERVDLSITSGEETFSPVRSSSDIEFPVKVPALADVATRLDRIDGRIEDLQAQVPDAQAITDLRTAAADARAAAVSADRTAMIGVLVGAAGVVVAVLSLWYAMRAGRRGAGPA